MQQDSRQARRISPEKLQTQLNAQWNALLNARKGFATLERRYVNLPKLWSDQVEQLLTSLAALREPLITIDESLARSERLPEGFAVIRYTLLQAIHHCEEQVDGLVRFLAPYQTHALEAVALFDARQRVAALKKSWDPLRKAYRIVGKWLDAARIPLTTLEEEA
jgi:hypothetical protein